MGKTSEAMEFALNNISTRAKKIIIVPEGVKYTDSKIDSIVLAHSFDVAWALILIANIKNVGIVSPELFRKANLIELINILINKNKATVVKLSFNPVACEIIHPIPKVGSFHVENNYEYSYGQAFCNEWETVSGQKGWGVRVIDNTQTDYVSPLTTLKGNPVVNMSHLFSNSQATTINFINWDTSNITNMKGMFNSSNAIHLDLSGFDTSKVTNMNQMFYNSKVTSLDVSNFNTSKVTSMRYMFNESQATILDVSNFDTANVTDMRGMFADSQATNLDLSSFDTSEVTSIDYMFSSSPCENLLAKTQVDANKYKESEDFPSGIAITVTT